MKNLSKVIERLRPDFKEPEDSKPWCAVCGASVYHADLDYMGQGAAGMSCMKCGARMTGNREVTKWYDSKGKLVLEETNP